MAGRKREPAIRVFASEYNTSNLETKAEEEYAPSYLISPLGVQMNRVYFIGVLTEKENIGNEAEPLWRARVKDPTGTFFLSAGSYQPEASQSIREIDPPSLVAVVGKIRTFTTDEGSFYVSVRPERVTVANKEQRDYWIYQAAIQTRARMQLYQKAVDQEELSMETLSKNDDMDEHLATGIVEAINHYGVVDIQNYKEAILEALNFIITGTGSTNISEMRSEDIIENRPDEGYDALTSSADAAGPDKDQSLEMEVVNVGDEESEEEGDKEEEEEKEEEPEPASEDDDGGEQPEEGEDQTEKGEELPEEGEDQPEEGGDQPEEGVEQTEEGADQPEEEAQTEGEEEQTEQEDNKPASDSDSEPGDDTEGLEQRICQAIKDLASGPRGASYHEVQEKLEGEGVNKTDFEESVNLLLDKGIIYEPSVNRINVVNY